MANQEGRLNSAEQVDSESSEQEDSLERTHYHDWRTWIEKTGNYKSLIQDDTSRQQNMEQEEEQEDEEIGVDVEDDGELLLIDRLLGVDSVQEVEVVVAAAAAAAAVAAAAAAASRSAPPQASPQISPPIISTPLISSPRPDPTKMMGHSNHFHPHLKSQSRDIGQSGELQLRVEPTQTIPLDLKVSPAANGGSGGGGNNWDGQSMSNSNDLTEARASGQQLPVGSASQQHSKTDRPFSKSNSGSVQANKSVPSGTQQKPQQKHHQSGKQQRLYKCKHCPFETNKKVENWQHIRLHMRPERMLACESCQFVTEYKHHLEYHQRNHTGYKPFKCERCDYQCVNKSMLNSHMKSHSSIYQYQCGTANCPYVTKYVHSLKMHLRKYKHQPAHLMIDVYGKKRGSKWTSSPSTQEQQTILDLRVGSKLIQ